MSICLLVQQNRMPSIHDDKCHLDKGDNPLRRARHIFSNINFLCDIFKTLPMWQGLPTNRTINPNTIVHLPYKDLP